MLPNYIWNKIFSYNIHPTVKLIKPYIDDYNRRKFHHYFDDLYDSQWYGKFTNFKNLEICDRFWYINPDIYENENIISYENRKIKIIKNFCFFYLYTINFYNRIGYLRRIRILYNIPTPNQRRFRKEKHWYLEPFLLSNIFINLIVIIIILIMPYKTKLNIELV